MSKKVLCENCLEEANYIVVNEDQLTHIKGIPVRYKGKRAYCGVCNQIVFVNDVLEYNKQQCYATFALQNPRYKSISV
jgi:hypothetical protein